MRGWDYLLKVVSVFVVFLCFYGMFCQPCEGGGVVLFSDTFPSKTIDSTKWAVISGAPTIDDYGTGEPSAPYSLRMNGYPSGGEVLDSKVLDLSVAGGAELTYWWEKRGGGESPDPGEDLVMWYWSGSAWVELARHSGALGDMTSYLKSNILLPVGALHSGFKMRISNTASTGSFDDWFVDDVSITLTDDFRVQPAGDFNSAGPVGGPFSPSSTTYTISNTGTSALDWTVSGTVFWLDVVPSSGTLLPGSSDSVVVSINTDANGLSSGVYSDVVTFTNVTSGNTQSRGVQLLVGAKTILSYIQYADIDQEYAHTLAAIDSLSTNYMLTELSDYKNLDAVLPGHDVLLIPEQEGTNLSTLELIGFGWRTTLQNFVDNGGVIVQCDGSGRYGILTGAGLMSIISSSSTSGVLVNVVAPSDPVAEGVSASYTGANGSSHYNTTEQTVVVERPGYGPVVINKAIGLGNVVLIGHDYYTSSSNQDRIVANSVFRLPTIKDDLKIAPTDDFVSAGEVGGPFSPLSKSYLLSNIGTSPLDWEVDWTKTWLDVTPAAGTLNGGDSVTVVLALNSGASLLPEGDYTDNVMFSNLTSGVEQSRGVTLMVGQSASMPFSEDFEGGLTLGRYWEVTGTNKYRTQVTTSYGPYEGLYHLTMDATSSSSYSRNELTLSANLANYKNVWLSFWAKEFSDEPHGPPPTPFYNGYDFDGVAISEDGYKWYEVQGLRTLSSIYGQINVDLDSAISTYGLSYNSNFKIRFNQYDNNPISTDGISIDDIKITGDLKDDLSVSPDTGLVSSGLEGGPFSPSGKDYFLTNIGTASLDWLIKTPVWLDAEPNSGTLQSGDANTVVVSFNSDANALDPNDYTGIISFINLSSDFVQTRPVSLEVIRISGEVEVTDSIAPADDFYMMFEDTIVGLARTERLTISNTDPNHYLVIEEIICSGACGKFTLTLPSGGPPWKLEYPDDEIIVDVNFAPTSYTDYGAVLAICSDDFDEPVIEVALSGTGIYDYLEVLPEEEYEFSGHPGGPFIPTVKSYQLTNTGSVIIEWAVDEPNWLDAEPNGGILQSGQSILLAVGPNAYADGLPAGIYEDDVVFIDITTTMEHVRPVSLEVYTDSKIWVSPRSFELRVPQGKVITEELIIGNSGDHALSFDIFGSLYEFVPAPEEECNDLAPAEIVVFAPNDHNFAVLADEAFFEGELLVRFAPQADRTWPNLNQKNAILAGLGGGNVEHEYEIVRGLSLVRLPAGMSVEDGLRRYNGGDGILYAEPDYMVELTSDCTVIPNDSRFSELWGMHNIGQNGGVLGADVNGPEAWCKNTDCSNIVVAILDTGIDYNHSDLIDNLWVNEAELNGLSGVDDDGNGYVDDIYGWDFADSDSDPFDYHGHGTHVAGTVGAIGDNSKGVVGICWSAKIMALKIFPNYNETAFISNAIKAIEYAVDNSACVLNNSWGGGPYSQSLKEAIESANDASVLFVASACNDGRDNDIYPAYPASYGADNIISVLSTDRYDNRSSFSNYGLTSVDIGAPGSAILSCEPGGGYQYRDGTSMSSPHISGSAAFIWSCHPFMTHLEVKELMLSTADPVSALSGRCVSGGRLNLSRAVSGASSWLEFLPSSGTVGATDSNEVRIILNGEQPAGTYSGEIRISSNDPYEPEVLIPISVTVESVDHFTEIFEPNGNDMAYRTLTFRPGIWGDYYELCVSDAEAFPVDPTGGFEVLLNDDDYFAVKLYEEKINFYGIEHDVFYIGSNGYITFESGDTHYFEGLVEHYELPRISALFDDLDPSSGGVISWKQLDDRVVVTFENVPEFSLSSVNSFQIEMRFNGKIRITLLDIVADDGLLGLSEGVGLPVYFAESDLSEYAFCEFTGDLNEDQDVDFSDFTLLCDYWRSHNCQSYNFWCDGCDINQDRSVDILDLQILAEHWLE